MKDTSYGEMQVRNGFPVSLQRKLREEEEIEAFELWRNAGEAKIDFLLAAEREIERERERNPFFFPREETLPLKTSGQN